MSTYDVISVGGGPAGLSAALLLGRCRRSVLVCDSRQYRNAASHGVHGFLTRDGIHPAKLLDIARRQLRPYAVEIRGATVQRIEKRETHFQITIASGSKLAARRVLLATGVVDKVPQIENIDRFYGKSVHHCPYCDAWEHRDQPLAAYGHGRPALGLALSLKTWSADVVLCTDGPSHLRAADHAELARYAIPLHTHPIASLEGLRGQLRHIVFKDGGRLARRAIFFNTGQYQHCSLAEDLGCNFNTRGTIQTDRFERTCIPGLFAVGDCARSAQFVAVAAAQGTIAAEAINVELQKEDREAFHLSGKTP